jgi:hypothetical protein
MSGDRSLTRAHVTGALSHRSTPLSHNSTALAPFTGERIEDTQAGSGVRNDAHRPRVDRLGFGEPAQGIGTQYEQTGGERGSIGAVHAAIKK